MKDQATWGEVARETAKAFWKSEPWDRVGFVFGLLLLWFLFLSMAQTFVNFVEFLERF